MTPPTPPAANTPRPRLYYGWWMVIITSVMSFFASGIFFRGFGVLVLPIRDRLDITQTQTNLVFAIARAEGGLEGPAAGWLIDKFGNRAVLVPSLLLAIAGYFLMAAWMPHFWAFAIVYLGIISVGNSMAMQHACFAGLNQWFHRRRALAISILAAFASLGGLALIPTMNLLIDRAGLRWGLIASGAFYAVILLPLCYWFRNRPEDLGLLPDGANRPPSPARTAAASASSSARRTTSPSAATASAGRIASPSSAAGSAGSAARTAASAAASSSTGSAARTAASAAASSSTGSTARRRRRRPPAPTPTRDYTVREALRTQAYWFLLAGAGLRQMATLGILISLFPILVDDKGMSRQMAANLVGIMSAVNFVSRLAMGYLGDRISKRAILAVSLAVEGIGYLFLWLGDWHTPLGIALVLAFVLCEGMMDGAGVIVWAALGEYYGRARFATLRGYITFAYAWALVASPLYAGWVADRFQNSYDYAIIPGALCALAAAACFLAVKKPPILTTPQPA